MGEQNYPFVVCANWFYPLFSTKWLKEGIDRRLRVSLSNSVGKPVTEALKYGGVTTC